VLLSEERGLACQSAESDNDSSLPLSCHRAQRVPKSRSRHLKAIYLVWSRNWIWFHHCPILAIMGFEDPESSRPIAPSAERRFRVDESTPTTGH
jgi:hypothetical protein